jgi:cold shock CspA family protein/predicted RNA-binding protein YlqC (UPF0109 family)
VSSVFGLMGSGMMLPMTGLKTISEAKIASELYVKKASSTGIEKSSSISEGAYMKELLRTITRTLVNSPEDIDIKEIELSPKTRLLEIKVSKQDVRKVLMNIQALRRIVSAASKGKTYYTIDVEAENGCESKQWIAKGKIKRLFEDRNYGFIATEDGRTIYFHASSLEGAGIRSLSVYQPVYFEAVEGPKGLRVVRVVPMTV